MAAYQLPIPEMFQLTCREDFPMWDAQLCLHLDMARGRKFLQHPMEDLLRADDGKPGIELRAEHARGILELRAEHARVTLFILSSISQALFDDMKEAGASYTEAFHLYHGIVARLLM